MKPQVKLSSEDWEWYLKKYGKLMWAIAHKISGDEILTSLEDNYEDLCVAALEAINGFHKKTGMSFKEMKSDLQFNKYNKTCLWNHKNNKGKKISKKIPFRNRIISLEEKLASDEPEVSFNTEGNMLVKELGKILDNNQKRVLDLITDDPSMFKGTGSVNISKLARRMEISNYLCKKILDSIGDIIGNDVT